MSLPEHDPAVSWEHFEHVADVGVRGRGSTMAAAFAGAARALTAVVTDLDAVRPVRTVRVHLDNADRELLLADWLNAVVYEMATRRMLFSRFDVRIVEGELDATLGGEPVDRARHQPRVEPKGATYTALRVAEQPDGRWLAQCVIDV